MNLATSRKDAEALWCPQCDAIIGDDCQGHWDMSKTKYLHENGCGHKPVYIKREAK